MFSQWPTLASNKFSAEGDARVWGSRGGKFVDGIADNFVNISLSRPAPDSPLHTIIASEKVYLDCNASTVSDISQKKRLSGKETIPPKLKKHKICSPFLSRL